MADPAICSGLFSSFNGQIAYFYCILYNCIIGVEVSVLTSSAVDRWFKPQSGQTKDYEIGICCFSAKNSALRSKS
jgi:hypothetical protein